ncbi:putative amidohydrolase [Kineothrix alysoides]|uniref:Putative amidohydrolase n=1 Tax=Kineothrix alysoides TaxID=1469948 RepID=A0A4V2QBS6_9FIRM|nr:nitrilase-related carbon-nitrogen hydrolase [Kineothrix alysoides]TCL57602.1 putative amidohydrolase [Kineothrix alysoides]
MKIALCQLNIEFEKIEENLKNAEQLLLKAKREEAELALFPEMSFTGFSMNVNKVYEYKKVIFDSVRSYAENYQINVGFGWVGKHDSKGENHYSIMSPEGEIVHDYVKIHPFSYSNENLYYIGGEHIKVGKVNDIFLATFICYDLRFPELFQYASNSAHFIVVPANWPKERREHWLTLLRARAIENQVYMIGVNCIGIQNNTVYSGDSVIFGPDGQALTCLSSGDGVFIYEIQDDVSVYRDKFPIKRDRRNDLYCRLLSEKIT